MQKGSKVVSFNLEKSIVSYDPKAAITSVNHDSVPRQSSPMERAEEVQANLLPELPSFAKPMLPSHVAGGFWLSFPKRFCDLHLPKHDDIVILVDESEQEFETKYLVDKNGLSGGWRGFSIAHKLLEKDVLVFQLIAPCKFKVYIVRANVLTEIDGAIGLLNLESCAKPMDIDHKEDMNMAISAIAKEKHSESHLLNNHEEKNHQEKAVRALKNEQDAAVDQSGMDSDDFGVENFEGIRFSQSVVDIKDVTGIENFNVVVDGLIIDSEIPSHLRVKTMSYYAAVKTHTFMSNFLKDLNLKLVGGIISEIINIADAIRSCKATDSRDNLKTWDNTLKAFEDLGMKDGFLRGRISKLLTLSSDSEEEVKDKRHELVKAEEEMRFLEMKLSNVKDVIKSLDDDIEALKLRGKKLEVVFTDKVLGSVAAIFVYIICGSN